MSTNEQIKNKTDPYLALRYLGFAEIGAYLGLFVWLFSSMGTSGVLSMFGQFFLLFYLAGLATLVPSVIAFLKAPIARDPQKIQTAKTLQKTLFIQVCIAMVPSMALLTSMPSLAIACVVGFIFFGGVLSITKPILASIQSVLVATGSEVYVDRAQEVHRGLYCAKCGSPLGAQGICPKCV